jgi:hypothetical protein
MKFLKIALAVAAVLVVLAAAGIFALQHYLASDAFKQVVLREASAAAGAPVEAKGFRFSLFSGVLLEDVAIGSAGKAFKEKQFFQGARIKLEYDLAALLGKKIRVTKIVFDAPVLTIEQNARGENNIPKGGKKQEPGAAAPAATGGGALPLDLNIDKLAITDGAVTVRRADGSESCSVDGFGLSSAIQLAGDDLSLQGNLQIKKVALGVLALENLHSPFVARNGRLQLTDIDAWALGGKLKGKGGLTYGDENLPFRLILKGSGLKLTELASQLAGTKSPMKGALDLDVTLETPLVAPMDVQGKGHAEIHDVSLGKNAVLGLLGGILKIPELGGGKFDLASSDFGIAKQVVTLSNTVLTAPLMTLKGGGTVTFDQVYDLQLVLTLQPKAAAAMPKELREAFTANTDGSLVTPPFRVYGPKDGLKQTLLEELLKKRAGAEIQKQSGELMNKLFQ